MPKKTALYERHVERGARMVEFAGYWLPVQYPTGPKEEHLRVRQAAGLFDIDHMGQVRVTGRDALSFLQHLMTADVSKIQVGQAHYALMCYHDGTIVDDTFIYRLPEGYWVVINAANNAKDTRWMEVQRERFEVRVDNVSEETYMLALQGPLAERILQPLCVADLSRLAYHTFVETRVVDVPTLIGRTGYTGEDGFELYFPRERAVHIWDRLLEVGEPQGLIPCGLAARDSLRLEACMPLYGQEISAERTPIEAGLGWAVTLEKGAFVGRDALLKAQLEGPDERLVAFCMVERGMPRHGYPVVVNGQEVGEVTSGIYSPTMDDFIGMAYVPVEFSRPGTEIGILIRGRAHRARVVRKPFYVPAYRR
ncbi:MAG: glycine cleavage system aminomethyltransferase GcvT [Chloroflexi bacterium]|nr:glycine cleavage system aminomethyltransferase GcvT [Chloroflexota bacterium]